MNAVVVMLVATTVLMDVLLIATPWIMPQTECFAVTVPAGARGEEPLRCYLRTYALVMGLVSLVGIVVLALMAPAIDAEVSVAGGGVLAPVGLGVCMLAPMVASFALMLHYRVKVQTLKAERGWHAEHVRSAALVGSENYPEPISMLWDLAYIPIVIALVVFGVACYDRFPDMIPVHANLAGDVVDYAPKTLGTILFPALIACYLGLMMTVGHWTVIHSKRPIDPDAPASSALAYGEFARKMSICLVVGGLTLCTLIGVLFYAASMGAITLLTAAVALMVCTLAYGVATAVLGLRMGQAGARLREASSTEDLSRDDDAHWPLGIFYVNRDDPSIVVPKRFGVGWTFNMGRPAGWVVLVGILLTAALFAWLSFQLVPQG